MGQGGYIDLSLGLRMFAREYIGRAGVSKKKKKRAVVSPSSSSIFP